MKNNIDRKTLIDYVNGNMEGVEKIRIEKKIREDDFLREAVEGIRASELQKLEDSFKDLDNRLTERVNRKSLPAYLAIAASIVVLITAAILLLYNNDFTEENLVSQAESEEESSAMVLDDSLGQEFEVKEDEGDSEISPKSPSDDGSSSNLAMNFQEKEEKKADLKAMEEAEIEQEAAPAAALNDKIIALDEGEKQAQESLADNNFEAREESSARIASNKKENRKVSDAGGAIALQRSEAALEEVAVNLQASYLITVDTVGGVKVSILETHQPASVKYARPFDGNNSFISVIKSNFNTSEISASEFNISLSVNEDGSVTDFYASNKIDLWKNLFTKQISWQAAEDAGQKVKQTVLLTIRII